MSVQNLSFPRQVLLVEIGRRCQFEGCEARNLIGLTKEEAIEYRGFECFDCKSWNDDDLRQADVPDWWDEINEVTGPLH